MEIGIHYLPNDVSKWDVTRLLAKILHSDEFGATPPGERLINFRVKLNPSSLGGARNNGTGILTLPTTAVGGRFLGWVMDNPIKIKGKKIKFYSRHHPPHEGVTLTLQKTPYINPDFEEERQQKNLDLQDLLRVDEVQFGFFYRPEYPSNDREPLMPRAFSIEWGRSYETSIGWLHFEYDHKLIRIKLGDQNTEQYGSSIAISFASIHKMGLGYDGKPYICFDTITPPVLEDIDFHRALIGEEQIDNRKYKHRIGSLHPGHKMVAPYAHQLRVTLYKDSNVDAIDKFIDMCKIAGIAADSVILRCQGPYQIEAHRRGFFSAKRLNQLRVAFSKLAWPVAFQFEALLHNALLHSEDVLTLLKPISELCKRYPQDNCAYAGNLLRRYGESLRGRSPRESPLKCFERERDKFVFVKSRLSSGNFLCCHVTFTPTRIILEGPYATQSNRVIRDYKDYQDHFIRVDFRDEDRLQFRWDRSVDGSSLLYDRVGGILKGGFELAGRTFEFLAYSTSALREHAVWFMNPFRRDGCLITSDFIRNSLGEFKGTKLLKSPSKYAARLAQAFTATDPSVEIRREEWEEVPDLGQEPYLFTDGVGTISKSLGDRIWMKLCEPRRDHGKNSIQPSVYQIRFLGFKGVVGVDEQLDKEPHGILMRLRGSMKKFDSSEEASAVANIEIAQAFANPNTFYLNRPLVMILEDRGVTKEVFLELQDAAVADARTIDESSTQFRTVLDSHGLGRSYRLSSILARLQDLELDLHPGKQGPGIDNPFLRQLRQVAMTDVLRDIKHSARIPVPDSYLLVGVADEGPAYRDAGYDNVYVLPEGHIYACVQRPGDTEPTWLSGSCSISRSPVVHPGDVQRVFAIGKPPEGKLCLFAHIKNAVVLPSVGTRSLASCLGGGDLDGDTFAVIQYSQLLPNSHEEAASYESAGTYTIDRDTNVEDICNFIVEYINSDVLGMLSVRLLIIADQSKDGIHDENCLWIAELCSQAVDYPKQGIPVDIDGDRLPSTLIRCTPDWNSAEVVSPRRTDYYESSRALGYMFRSITLDEPEAIQLEAGAHHQPLTDPISRALQDRVRFYLHDDDMKPGGWSPETLRIFEGYADELRYICVTHTISNTPGVRLLEAEVVVGTILAKCPQRRWRQDRTYRMRLHAQTLVEDIQRVLLEHNGEYSREDLQAGLARAWQAWNLGLSFKHIFGANSFGLIALNVIFDCLDKLAESL